MVWHIALKSITRLEYEYAQVAVDLFYENVSLVHYLVVVCNNVLPLVLYLKECVIISKFGPTVLCGLTRETRLTRHKPIPWCMGSLNCMNCSTLNSDPFIQWFLGGENEMLYDRIIVCLSQEQLVESTMYIINWFRNWNIKTS